MLMVISPAKNLDFTSKPPPVAATEPRLLDQTQLLISQLKGLDPTQVGQLMGLSDQLAELNYQRFQDFTLPLPESARPAVFAFNGDVYQGLDAASLRPKSLNSLGQNLRILSGLYGLLRPFDRILPYRLEMGTKLPNSRGKDLYGFWGSRLTELLAQDLAESGQQTLVNLASNEYYKALKPKELDAEVITPQFRDLKNGEYKMISFFAKKARGLMCRFVTEQSVDRPEGLKDFNLKGYRFDPVRSKPLAPVFLRDEPQ
ncbi:MAG: peroxide stress protein YaaA [bacterium]|nr:peroxide stress protein YaaA [bacterium]